MAIMDLKVSTEGMTPEQVTELDQILSGKPAKLTTVQFISTMQQLGQQIEFAAEQFAELPKRSTANEVDQTLRDIVTAADAIKAKAIRLLGGNRP